MFNVSFISVWRAFGACLQVVDVAYLPSSMQQALHAALADARMSLRDVDGLIAVPSLAAPHFMEAHFVATQVGLLPSRNVLVRTIDTGGAGPISAVLEAKRMITVEGRQVVAVVAGDAVASMPRDQFLERADATCRAPQSPLPSPHIPNAYDMVARWHMERYGVRRETLAKCASLMTLQASRHPEALTRVPKDVYAILSSPSVAPATTIAECARRADGECLCFALN